MSNPLISPTVGRVAWYYPSLLTGEAGFTPPRDGEPLAAIVAHVWNDTMVNLAVFDANGTAHSRTSVRLIHEDLTGDRPSESFCTWMPYQKGQARAAAAAPAPVGSHAEVVLYPAIREAMAELAQLPAGFNFSVDRAFNHLHSAFWSEVPAPASTLQLRPLPPLNETKAYSDGTSAKGPGPLPEQSPGQQDAAVEQQLQAKGKTAPRVTPDDLAANIVDTEIVKHVAHSGQILRWAVLTTRSGFAVTGRPSAAVSAENDDPEIGVATAIENARNELWPLMGYALKQRLHDASKVQA
ncbi:Gp49 family protein [Variovorax boronicumulans]|uniref:Gp49 family protein n=1 Tax=Variovorax boronicumulans TaxID=436515 RepID=UPI0012E4CB25|nr:Gp49 family protein [Variovorax boronicumulans]GER16699.1 hypothetical protein VCH24_17050 [Variovorax boronicumulans]